MLRKKTPEQAELPESVKVRKTFQLGKFVIGRLAEPGQAVSPGEMPSSKSPDPSSADSRERRIRSIVSRFILQRPVIYSGCQTGFFESDAIRPTLEEIMGKGRPAIVPHATIIEPAMAQRIVERHEDSSLHEIADRCRQFADKLPDRRYGHVKAARLFGSKEEPYLALVLDQEGAHRLGKDVTKICDRFEVGFDQRKFSPHISIVKMYDAGAAREAADELNGIIDHADSLPAIAFGGPTVLLGTNGA